MSCLIWQFNRSIGAPDMMFWFVLLYFGHFRNANAQNSVAWMLRIPNLATTNLTTNNMQQQPNLNDVMISNQCLEEHYNPPFTGKSLPAQQCCSLLQELCDAGINLLLSSINSYAENKSPETNIDGPITYIKFQTISPFDFVSWTTLVTEIHRLAKAYKIPLNPLLSADVYRIAHATDAVEVSTGNDWGASDVTIKKYMSQATKTLKSSEWANFLKESYNCMTSYQFWVGVVQGIYNVSNIEEHFGVNPACARDTGKRVCVATTPHTSCKFERRCYDRNYCVSRCFPLPFPTGIQVNNTNFKQFYEKLTPLCPKISVFPTVPEMDLTETEIKQLGVLVNRTIVQPVITSQCGFNRWDCTIVGDVVHLDGNFQRYFFNTQELESLIIVGYRSIQLHDNFEIYCQLFLVTPLLVTNGFKISVRTSIRDPDIKYETVDMRKTDENLNFTAVRATDFRRVDHRFGMFIVIAAPEFNGKEPVITQDYGYYINDGTGPLYLEWIDTANRMFVLPAGRDGFQGNSAGFAAIFSDPHSFYIDGKTIITRRSDSPPGDPGKCQAIVEFIDQVYFDGRYHFNGTVDPSCTFPAEINLPSDPTAFNKYIPTCWYKRDHPLIGGIGYGCLESNSSGKEVIFGETEITSSELVFEDFLILALPSIPELLRKVTSIFNPIQNTENVLEFNENNAGIQQMLIYTFVNKPRKMLAITHSIVTDIRFIDDREAARSVIFKIVTYRKAIKAYVTDFATHAPLTICGSDSQCRTEFNVTTAKLTTPILKAYLEMFTALSAHESLARSHKDNELVVDMEAFLGVARAYLSRYHDVVREDQQIKQLQERAEAQKKVYQSHIEKVQTKIDAATNLIENEAKQEINKVIDEIKGILGEVIGNIEKAKTETKEQIEDLKKQVSMMKAQLEHKKTFGWFKFAAQCVGLFSPVLGMALEFSGDVAAVFADPDKSKTWKDKAAKIARISANQLESLAGSLKEVKDGMDETQKQMKESKEKAFDGLKDDKKYKDLIDEHLPSFHEADKNLNKFATASTDDLITLDYVAVHRAQTKFRTGMDTLLQKINEDEEEFTLARNKRQLDPVSIAQAALQSTAKKLNMIAAGIEFSAELEEDEKKIQEIEAKIEELKEKLKKYDALKIELIATFVPVMLNLKTFVDDYNSDSIGPASLAAIDLDTTKLKNIISTFREKLTLFVKDQPAELKIKIQETTQRLENTLTGMLNMFERIEQWKSELDNANYIYEMTKPDLAAVERELSGPLPTPEENQVFNRLQKTTAANFAISYYRRTLTAFHVFTFPFAKRYVQFSLYNLPLADQNLTDILVAADKQFADLELKLKEAKATIISGDDSLEYHSFYNNLTGSAPFFTWKHENYSSQIERMLKGEKVALVAHIFESLPTSDAIKFTLIDLTLTPRNEQIREGFAEALKTAKVVLTHSGVSYFRFAEKYFVFDVSTTNSIEFCFNKHANGDPICSNPTYEKLKSGDFNLSPYNEWMIQLYPALDGDLSAFEPYLKEEIDVHLCGKGSFFDTQRSNPYEWQAEEFYAQDLTLANLVNYDESDWRNPFE